MSPRVRDPIRTATRTVGELFVTVGVVLLLFVGYSVYWTDVASAGKQRDATAELEQRWAARDPVPLKVGEPGDPQPAAPASLGDGLAKLHIPALGADHRYTVLQGTSQDVLAAGPGHYPGTALPGQRGNFAVAGHRVGKGSPFDDLHLLQACDALVVETAQEWFVYRMLGACPDAPDLGPEYSGVSGREIVDPSDTAVINPVPDAASDVVPSVALLTLTTCHPRFSARERMIIHAVLVTTTPKDGPPPAELTEG